METKLNDLAQLLHDMVEDFNALEAMKSPFLFFSNDATIIQDVIVMFDGVLKTVNGAERISACLIRIVNDYAKLGKDFLFCRFDAVVLEEAANFMENFVRDQRRQRLAEC